MKKITQLGVVLFVAAITFASCASCETCTVYDSNGVTVSVLDEYCDKDEKEAAAEVANLAAVSVNGTYTCD